MRALILAAGQGQRLRPLTDTRPKCLVRLGGVPLLDLSLESLKSAGVRDIGVVGGYRAEQLDSRAIPVYLNREYATTNMVYSLFCAQPVFESAEDLLIVYGDIVFEPRVVQALIECDAPLSVVVDRRWENLWNLRMDDPLSDAETLKLGPSGRLLELGKKPASLEEIEAQYIGMIKVRADRIEPLRQAYRALPKDRSYEGRDLPNMFMTSFLQHLIDEGWEVQAVPVESGWLEVDTTDDLAIYHKCLADGTLHEFYDSPSLRGN